MNVGDVYLLKSFRAERPGITLEFSASGQKRRFKKGEPRPAFVMLLLGKVDDLEHPELFDPNAALRELGWTPNGKAGHRSGDG